ncbi:hypothetical protein ABIE73_004841 [Bradyrhizobium yuanmingense]
MTEQISTRGTRERGRQQVEPDAERHQRRAETGQSRDEAAGERAEQQQDVGERFQRIVLVARGDPERLIARLA